MTPPEFLVASGLPPTEGAKLIARVCNVCQSAVWYWLAGERKWKPCHEKLLQIYSECTDAQRATWWPQ